MNIPSAILLLYTNNYAEKTLLKRLSQMECVKEVHRVQSVYDIVVKVKTEAYKHFSTIVLKIKQMLPKPENIVTMLIIENKN